MTQALTLAVLLVIVGAILLIAETVLPTFGILGILGGLCVLGSVITCFWINPWLGTAMLVTLAIISPLLFSLAMRLWPRTPVGKKLILNYAEAAPPKPSFTLGQVGVAMTEMRPIGECEFDSKRLEAMSELGIIPAGSKVKIVSLGETMPVVRKVEA